MMISSNKQTPSNISNRAQFSHQQQQREREREPQKPQQHQTHPKADSTRWPSSSSSSSSSPSQNFNPRDTDDNININSTEQPQQDDNCLSEALLAVASAEEYAAKITKLQQACLRPLKEDLADWLNTILNTSTITTDNFMDTLDNGVVICRLAKIISIWCLEQLATKVKSDAQQQQHHHHQLNQQAILSSPSRAQPHQQPHQPQLPRHSYFNPNHLHGNQLSSSQFSPIIHTNRHQPHTNYSSRLLSQSSTNVSLLFS